MSNSNTLPAKPIYDRVLLKISGESLLDKQSFGIQPKALDRIAHEIKTVHQLNIGICLVVGGGNIFRGLQGSSEGMERTTADHMGMLATVINALALQSVLERQNITTRVLSALPITQVCEPYVRRRAVRHLEKKRVCIFAAGTGNPYFTTDTAAVLRASEMGCKVICKGTKVDGVYNKDPAKNSDAKHYRDISYDEFLQKNLAVMDAAAVALARSNNLPIIVFSFNKKGGFYDILNGKGKHTLVHKHMGHAS